MISCLPREVVSFEQILLTSSFMSFPLSIPSSRITVFSSLTLNSFSLGEDNWDLCFLKVLLGGVFVSFAARYGVCFFSSLCCCLRTAVGLLWYYF